jgi:hypothetical protein
MSESGAPHAPIPNRFVFGDGIDWSSPLDETTLYVELPFWLMMSPGSIEIEWAGRPFTVHVCGPWMEVFVHEMLDSRASQIFQGPLDRDYQPPKDIAALLAEQKAPWMRRRCKTMLRLNVRAHGGAFPPLDSNGNATGEQEAYWTSMCDAHIPVINELIQRYRLATYDYFAYEVSAWDVPVWFLKHAGMGYRATLIPYKSWDAKPLQIEAGTASGEPETAKPFEWATADDITKWSSDEATPGEFDLLDARSLMERGDYTGAVRRTVTAIEALLGWALLRALEEQFPQQDAIERLAKTDNDFPGRLRQWKKLAKPKIAQVEFDEFEQTRAIRHEIVHRGRRLDHNERGRAQRAVDTSRWLYNKIEAKPDRARLRDFGTQKSIGREALTVRFPATISASGIVLGPIA